MLWSGTLVLRLGLSVCTITQKLLKLKSPIEFCTHDDLEAPRRGCDFGSKRSEVKVARYKVGAGDGFRSVGVLV